MLGLNTPYSHVAVKMVDGDTGQTVYYQASGLQVNCIGDTEFMAIEQIIYQKDVQVSDAIFVKGKTFAINQLSKPYNVMAIFGFGLQIALRVIGIKINNPFKADGSQWVCSQLGGAYIDECEGLNLDITNMTPKALYDVMPSVPSVWQ